MMEAILFGLAFYAIVFVAPAVVWCLLRCKRHEP